MFVLRPAPPGDTPIGNGGQHSFPIPYRETLTRATEINYTHKKQTGATGQFARVKLAFEPLPPGSGFAFANEIVGDSIPKEFIPGVERGIKAVMISGLLLGFPIIDVKVRLIDGAFHDTDSSELAFEIATRAAFRTNAEALPMALLEPIMRVEVITPENYVGSVIGNLNARRGVVEDRQDRSDGLAIRALVPLANMFNFVAELAQLTEGSAIHTATFAGYAEVSGDDDPRFRPAMAMRA